MKDLLKALFEGESLDWIVRPVARRFGYFARSARRYYYFGLAALFIVAIGANAVWQAVREEAKKESLDLAIRARLSSPKPDHRIVILDIDERSLALLARRHGRWPWPRSVLAEAIAGVAQAGARAVYLNVMLSDPDKADPHGDQVFDEVAAATANAVFPMIRLNPRNDVESAVRAGMLPGVRLSDPRAAQTPIAVLLPMFAGTHDKLGVSNLTHDQDGVVRRYAVWWQEAGFALPSVALRAARLLGGANAERAHDEIILNWRNKRGDYRRISFADYYFALEGGAGFPPDAFKDAVVILGASAPGIANTKPTASAPVLDDNVIVATAIDDIVNDTHLRVLPGWASALISCLLVLLTARAFQRDVPEKSVNRWFVFAQGALVVVTVGSASYSVYLVDLSACFLFGLGYFFIAKAYAQIDHNASRGMPSFTEIRFDPRVIDRVAVFGFDAKAARRPQINRARGGLERRFGFSRTFHIDNAFGVANLFGGTCKDLEFFVVFLEGGELPRAGPRAVTASALFGPAVAGARIRGISDVRELTGSQAGDSDAIQREVGRALLGIADRLINPQPRATAGS